jgi:hypothetical protein
MEESAKPVQVVRVERRERLADDRLRTRHVFDPTRLLRARAGLGPPLPFVRSGVIPEHWRR